jgi:hypothetical protein
MEDNDHGKDRSEAGNEGQQESPEGEQQIGQREADGSIAEFVGDFSGK